MSTQPDSTTPPNPTDPGWGAYKESLPDVPLPHGWAAGRLTPTMKQLPDGRVACNKTPECHYIAAKAASVVPHMTSHSKTGEASPSEKLNRTHAGRRHHLAERMRRLAEEVEGLDNPVTNTTWKDRAQAAERELSALKRKLAKFRELFAAGDAPTQDPDPES